MKSSGNQRCPNGAGLLEFLVALAALGVIGVIAVPRLIGAREQERRLTAQHNAQRIVAMANAARNAGHDFLADTSDLSEVVKRVRSGHSLTVVQNAELAGSYFGLPSLSSAECADAATYLTLNDVRLAFRADTSADSNASLAR